ncbi:MAG TPA: 4'-phosphopantetheinyl transferase superfamily protein [Acidimicrobiales bacterium]|nr:4'-phosphopantetheinyl transferase superfamily protein [Acidimicrobiales bacterium]
MSTLDRAGEAIAAELLRSDGDLAGIGIDYEPWRKDVDLRTSRFFLRPPEQAHATDARGLLRLWTVKEALFKATPDNADATLLAYEISDPAGASGCARGPRGEQIRYVSLDLDGGVLAVAACLAAGSNRAAV